MKIISWIKEHVELLFSPADKENVEDTNFDEYLDLVKEEKKGYIIFFGIKFKWKF